MPAKQICPNCNKAIEVSSGLCPECGSPLQLLSLKRSRTSQIVGAFAYFLGGAALGFTILGFPVALAVGMSRLKKSPVEGSFMMAGALCGAIGMFVSCIHLI